MIGLKRGRVELAPYNPAWVGAYEMEKKKLEKILGTHVVAIEHCGSTAIPGIKAKPVIDVLVGVKSVKREGKMCDKILDALPGYFSRAKAFPKKDRFVVSKGTDTARTHYVHIVRYKGCIWNNLIFFRDYLRTHKKVAVQYSKLKEVLSTKHIDERRTYTKKKSVFVKKILKKNCQRRYLAMG